MDDESFSCLGMLGISKKPVGGYGRIGRIAFMLGVPNDVAGVEEIRKSATL